MVTVTEDRGLGSEQKLTEGIKNKAGRMPAIAPSGGPKSGSNGSPREKVGPNFKSGGMGSGATPLNPQKGGRLEKWVQDVSETHDTTRHDDGSSTSTTYGQDCTPAMGAGYGCSNGMGRATNCRD